MLTPADTIEPVSGAPSVEKGNGTRLRVIALRRKMPAANGSNDEHAAGASMPPDIAERNHELRDLNEYFMHLDVHFASLGVFAAKWMEVGKFEAPKNLSWCLNNIAHHFLTKKDNKFRFKTVCEGRQIMADHISVWKDAALPVIDRFTPKDLALTMLAFGQLGINPGRDFMAAWIRVAIEKMPGFNQQALCMALTGLSDLACDPGPEFMRAWIEAESTIHMRDENSNYEEGRLFQHHALNLRALAIQDALNPREELKYAAAAIFEKSRDFKITGNRELHQLFDPALWFGLPYPYSLPLNINTTSEAEKILSAVFREAGIALVEPVQPIPVLNHQPDLQVQLENGCALYIEADGPSHFVLNTEIGEKHYNGSWVLRSAIKSRLGNAITVHVPYTFTDDFIKNYFYLKAQGQLNCADTLAGKFSEVLKDLCRQVAEYPAPGVYRIPADYGAARPLAEERPPLVFCEFPPPLEA